MPDYTTLPQKIEAAFAAYLLSVRTSMDLSGVQVITAQQSAAAVDSPRIVIQTMSMSPRDTALPGVMDAVVNISYISDFENTAETHKTAAAKLTSWLCDTAAIKTALNVAVPDRSEEHTSELQSH